MPGGSDDPGRGGAASPTLDIEALQAHLVALNCDRYEIAVIDAQNRLRRAVLTANQVPGETERLAALNIRGDDVLVRPATGLASGLVVIDDLTAEGLRRLEEDGHTPVIVTGTPDGRSQAWIRLASGEIDPRVAAEAARLLQGRYALTDEVAHLGPLAGCIDHTGARPALGEGQGAALPHGVAHALPLTTIQAIGEEVGRVTPAAERMVAEAREHVAAQDLVPQRDTEMRWGAWVIEAFAEEMHRDELTGTTASHYRRGRRAERDELGGRDGR